ncbi:hypothetical protein BC830DRAFT_1130980 [Chytriomyces sp. MP71]|nr:hypothetical protein BC830DRAFT_1130980 [Chytriomyces sp. MP71]
MSQPTFNASNNPSALNSLERSSSRQPAVSSPFAPRNITDETVQVTGELDPSFLTITDQARTTRRASNEPSIYHYQTSGTYVAAPSFITLIRSRGPSQEPPALTSPLENIVNESIDEDEHGAGDSAGLQRLLNVIESIARLEDQEREYRAQIEAFTRRIEAVESLIGTSGGMNHNSNQQTAARDPSFTHFENSTHLSESVRNGPSDLTFRLFDLNDAFSGSRFQRAEGNVVRGGYGMTARRPQDGRQSRLGRSEYTETSFTNQNHRHHRGRVPAYFNFDFDLHDDEEDVESDDDDAFAELNLSQFNSAMTGLRLIYQNRRHHHVRVGSATAQSDSESESSTDEKEQDDETARAPMFFEDGYASVLENWLISQPILDSNGVALHDLSAAMDSGVGFSTPEGNGGTDLLWRQLDANGNVRLDSNGQDYTEIIEVRNASSSSLRMDCKCENTSGSNRSVMAQSHDDDCPLNDVGTTGTINFTGMQTGSVTTAIANARRRAVHLGSQTDLDAAVGR